MPTIDWKRTLTSLAIFLFILLGAVWYFRPTSPEDANLQIDRPVPMEKLQLDLTGSDWHLEREQQQENKVHRQYRHSSEAPEAWTELISTDAFFGLQDQGSPEEFATLMEKNIREWGGDKITWRIIKASGSNLTYEWQVVNREGTADQHSLGRIVRSKAGLHLAVYSAKTSGLSPLQRDAWLQRLEAAQLLDADN